MTTPTAPILAAIDAFSDAVRFEHPELPPIVFVVGSIGRSATGQTHGHFAPKSWEGGIDEIMLSGESLARGAVATVGTLLHEFAHALAHERKVKDTSNKGRYHNDKFRSIANELGVNVQKYKRDTKNTQGYTKTSVPEETVAFYQGYIDDLDAAITTWRTGYVEVPDEPEPEEKPKVKKSIRIKCYCEDTKPLTVPITWWEAREETLTCDLCGEHYSEKGSD